MHDETPRNQTRPDAAPPLYRFFATIARRYDLLNRVITLGFDERWRRMAAAECLRDSPARMLDLCCGTGDLLLRAVRMSRGRTEIVGADYSPQMLAVARHKLRRAGLSHRASLALADAAALPFADCCFDAVGIAFAFRNLVHRNPNRNRHLAEMRRVLAPDGRLVVVESSQPAQRAVRAACHAYTRAVVPVAARLLSENNSAYRYLAASVIRFDPPERIAELLRDSGFGDVTYRPLLFGASALHVATGRTACQSFGEGATRYGCTHCGRSV